MVQSAQKRKLMVITFYELKIHEMNFFIYLLNK